MGSPPTRMCLTFFIVLVCHYLKQIQKLESKQVWIWIWAVFKAYLQTFRWEVCCKKESMIKKINIWKSWNSAFSFQKEESDDSWSDCTKHIKNPASNIQQPITFDQCLANVIWKKKTTKPGLQISLLQLDLYIQITYQQVNLKPDVNFIPSPQT